MTLPYNQKSQKSILDFARKLLGKNFSSFLNKNIIGDITGKGRLGQFTEKYYFEKDLDNESKPDFPDAPLELKVCPVKIVRKNQIVAKERVVLSIIDYCSIIEESWSNSHFLYKNMNILFMFYLFKEGQIPIDYVIKIVEVFRLDYNKDDFEILKSDWILIKEKIASGNAHEISEADTLYLGACTKGATAEESYRKQPKSTILAKQRAFSLKASYVNFILNYLVNQSLEYESLFSEFSEVGKKRKIPNLIELIQSKFSSFIGKTAFEIGELLGIQFNGQKNYYSLLTSSILGIKDLSKVAEFEKANILPKTIRVSSSGLPLESLSFPAFKISDLVTESWDDSGFKYLLESTKFLFIVYRIRGCAVDKFRKLPLTERNKYLYLEKVQFWNAPYSDIETHAFEVWNKTVNLFKEGLILQASTDKNKGVKNNLPKSSETYMVHIRPHGKNAADIDFLPNGLSITKQCFWLNRSYIKDVLK